MLDKTCQYLLSATAKSSYSLLLIDDFNMTVTSAINQNYTFLSAFKISNQKTTNT